MTFTYKIAELLSTAETCNQCRQSLETTLQKIPGIQNPQVTANEVRLEASSDPKHSIAKALAANKLTHAHSTFKVEGMDCASCARTVEGALNKMPGISGFKLNYIAEKIDVAYNPQQARLKDFKSHIEPHGYKVFPLTAVKAAAPQKSDAPHESDHDHATADASVAGRPWYNTRQGRPVAVTGVLLALAWLLGRLEPSYAQWGYALATFVGGWPFAVKAYRSALVGNPFSINTLMSVAAVGAVLIGEPAEAAAVVFLFAVGELLEGLAAGRARAGIRSLAALAPKTALVYHASDHGDGHGIHTHEVPVEQLKVGQTVLVQPGGRVPADGTILSGNSALDDSPVTGESVPVNKSAGDSVYAGSINTDAVIAVRVEKTAQDNTIARIIHMVEEAQSSKAPTERFIDRFSRFYTPAVMLVSLLVILVPPLMLGGSWHAWIYKGLALLLIGCPCALLISVPAAIASGISAGARLGLLIKGGAVLETVGQAKTIAFDKTGTLTEGKPQVTNVQPIGLSEEELLGLAAAVEQGSAHPLAKAIMAKAVEAKAAIPSSSGQMALQGKAVTAEIGGQVYAVGSPRFAAETVPLEAIASQIEALEQQGKTVTAVFSTKVLGLIAIRDEPRADAQTALTELKGLGVRGVMLTGDNARTAAAIAKQLGIEAQAELLPQDKLRLIGGFKQSGIVAMVGDGINDAPALAQADVGIAMGGGTDVALETADAALLRNSVKGVADLVVLSRATLSNVRSNIAIALGLKLVFLITTLMGVTNLWMAILADTGATVLVTANALRLLGFRR